MKVRCIAEEPAPEQRQSLRIPDPAAGFGLQVGHEYIVLAIYCFVESAWGSGAILQIQPPDDPLPSFAPACLFEVIDSIPSRYWQAESWDLNLALAPPLLLEPHFVEDLANGESNVVAAYRRLLEDMEMEFER